MNYNITICFTLTKYKFIQNIKRLWFKDLFFYHSIRKTIEVFNNTNTQ